VFVFGTAVIPTDSLRALTPAVSLEVTGRHVQHVDDDQRIHRVGEPRVAADSEHAPVQPQVLPYEHGETSATFELSDDALERGQRVGGAG
jgi:hypothetical protein